MMGMKRLVLTLLLSSWLHQGGYGFQPLHPQRQSRNLQVALAALRVPQNPLTSSNNKQGNPPENLLVEDRSDNEEAPSLNTAPDSLTPTSSNSTGNSHSSMGHGRSCPQRHFGELHFRHCGVAEV
ncbi:expressed unknown protein [Seminavis robusta]|uniref:Uncharacterized protein n=1 Tax=Seminavis robusta TaxID=568900 RepID=A0A9N8F0I9_9STRA|nr:expressed unknown protein [Seminavis robusta]|eukprot:Sro2416_g326860.1 n/a (125) ;mRNA; f:1022-1396